MKYAKPIAAAAVALLLASCGEHRGESSDAAPSPSPATSAATGTSSGEPPSVTASSAAASAPECKDLKQADPKTCNPDAKGQPQAR